ncbi:MAG: AAA family ATPase [Phycisphaerales bacterium]
MSHPSVILIGGPPGAGKTTLGQALAVRLNGVSITADDLLTAAQGVTDRTTHPGLHVMRTGDSVAYFTDRPVSQLMADASEQAEALWPAIRQLVERRARDATPYILDGWMLRPDRVAELDRSRVGSLWLIPSAETLAGREGANPFFARSHDPDRMLTQFLARSRWCSELVASTAAAHGLPILRQDGSVDVATLCDRAVEALEADGA